MQSGSTVRSSWRLSLRLRLWPWMIVVAVAAVISAVGARLVLGGWSALAGRPLSLALAVVVWAIATALVLAGLAWVVDRPGHGRRWRVLGAASLAVPLAVLALDLCLARRLGQLDPTEVLALIVFNCALLVWSWRFVPSLWPGRCPVCGVPALIPVLRRGEFRSESDDDIRECAECLALFRRPRRRGTHDRASPRWIRFEPCGPPR